MSRFGAPIAVVLALVLGVPGLLVVASWQQQNTSCATTSTATGADTSVPLPAGAAGAELTVRMGTWNVLKSNSTKRIVAGLQSRRRGGGGCDRGAGAAVLHRGTVARQLRAAGWSMSDGNTATPVVWRAGKYKLLAQGRVKEFGVVRIEPGSAAGASIGPKWIQWAQLQDVSTGAVFIAASHHLVPGIESKGRTDRHGPRRVAYAKKQILAAGPARPAAGPERADPVPDRLRLERRRPQRRPHPHTRLPLRRCPGLGCTRTGGCSATRGTAPTGTG